MMRNLIPELHGPDALAEAGQAALYDRRVAGVLVRGVIDGDHMAGFLPDDEKFLEQLYAAIPQWAELDKVIAAWSTNIGKTAITASKQVHKAKFIKESSTAHLDKILKGTDYTPGPLTASLRIDRNDHLRRRFVARRFGRTTLNRKGILSTNAVHWAETWPAHIGLHVPSFGRFGRVEQRPTDVFIIPNHPAPAIHAIYAEEGLQNTTTTALVMDYALHIQSAVQNTNSSREPE